MPTDPTSTPKGPVEPIQRRKLADQVFERLWDLIVAGEFAPGDALPSERTLMERFGVGRPAVREALQSLAGKGLITIAHGERSRVNVLDASTAFGQVDGIARLLLTEPSNLDHLKEVRKVLETGTVRLAAGMCTDDDARALRALVDEQRDRMDDGKAFVRADIAFHVRIAAITGNPLLQGVTRAMLSWLFEHYRPLLRWSGRETTTLLEHDQMIELLASRDAEGAARMMRDHLNRSDPLYTSGGRGSK